MNKHSIYAGLKEDRSSYLYLSARPLMYDASQGCFAEYRIRACLGLGLEHWTEPSRVSQTFHIYPTMPATNFASPSDQCCPSSRVATELTGCSLLRVVIPWLGYRFVCLLSFGVTFRSLLASVSKLQPDTEVLACFLKSCAEASIVSPIDWHWSNRVGSPLRNSPGNTGSCDTV